MAPYLFAARHRYTGVAVGHNIGVLAVGGTTPAGKTVVAVVVSSW